VEVKTEEKMINGERTDKRYDTLVQETWDGADDEDQIEDQMGWRTTIWLELQKTNNKQSEDILKDELGI